MLKTLWQSWVRQKLIAMHRLDDPAPRSTLKKRASTTYSAGALEAPALHKRRTSGHAASPPLRMSRPCDPPVDRRPTALAVGASQELIVSPIMRGDA